MKLPLFKTISNFKNIIFLFIILVFSNFAYGEEKSASSDFYLKESIDDFGIGNKNSPVTIIEYSSFSCPHCGYFHTTTFEKIKENFIDKGEVRWINRQFVSDNASLKGALLASCNGGDKYFLFLKILFLKQSSWAFNVNFEEVLKNIGRLSGISDKDFDKCMNDKEKQSLFATNRTIASKILGVHGTPIFFINGKEHKSHNYDSFVTAINTEIKIKQAINKG